MDNRSLKTKARASLAGNWGVSIAVALVASLLGALLTGNSFLPEMKYDVPLDRFPALAQYVKGWNEGLQIGTLKFNFRAGIFGFAAFLMGGVLQMGYADFLLKQHDGKETNFRDLFSKFDYFGTGFAQHFLRGLYTILWMLLFIIPGIIKSYSYAMTPFILAENPRLTASQAIERSEDMMDGHKGELFFLDLSFIGWSILAAMTLNLGNIALNPYKNAAYAAFYRQLQAERQYTFYES
jgi:uncharacterized membrane protein